jgi:Flp pilus assembly protein TadG
VLIFAALCEDACAPCKDLMARRKGCMRISRSRQRRGTAVVETAFVLPVYLLLLLGVAEFGHAQLIVNLLNSACRNAARVGSTEGTTNADVIERVQQTVGTAVPTSKITIYVKNAATFDGSGTPPSTDSGLESLPDVSVSALSPRQMFMVRVKVAYNDIALVPMPFLKNKTLDAQAFMRHE